MCRQIDSCANGTGELIMGTKGYTNCQNTIWDLNGKIKWTFKYPVDENGNSLNAVKIPPYIQEHMHLVYAIRTGNYVNEAEQTAISTLTAIMGRTAAYTGKLITWDGILKSDMNLGPSRIEFGPVDMVFDTPIPGTPITI
jgi:myo-inositol 2-dehydrogenase/D-chiro-inositol 1-dehydrogenase